MNNTLQLLKEVPEEHTLLLGDWLKKIRTIPDSSVDFACIDPPYGVTDNKWDKTDGLNDLYPELKRVCKPHAPIAVFAAHTFIAKLLAFDGFAKAFKYKYVWDKGRGGGFLNARRLPMRQHEDILIFKSHVDPITFTPQKTEPTCAPKAVNKGKRGSSNYRNSSKTETYTDDGSRYLTDILRFTQARDRGLHPTQKPVDLIRHLIRSHCADGGTVLDCFAGSGSTAIAAIREGRKAIAIERDIKYFRTIVNRVLAE